MEELFKKTLKGIKHENNRVAIDNFSTISSLIKDNSILSSPKKIKSSAFKYKPFLNQLTNYEYVDNNSDNEHETEEKNEEDDDLIIKRNYKSEIKDDNSSFKLMRVLKINGESEGSSNNEKNEENEKKEEYEKKEENEEYEKNEKNEKKEKHEKKEENEKKEEIKNEKRKKTIKFEEDNNLEIKKKKIEQKKEEEENIKNEIKERLKDDSIVLPINKKRKRFIITDEDNNISPKAKKNFSRTFVRQPTKKSLSSVERRKEYNQHLKTMNKIKSSEKEVKLIQKKWRLFFKKKILNKIIIIQSFERRYIQIKKLKSKKLLISNMQKSINSLMKILYLKNFKFLTKILKRIIQKKDIGIQVQLLKEEIIHHQVCLKTFPRPYHEIGKNIIKVDKSKNRFMNKSIDISVNTINQMIYEGKTGKLISLSAFPSEKIKKHMRYYSFRNLSNSNKNDFSEFKKKKIVVKNYDIFKSIKYLKRVRKRVIFKKWNLTTKIDNYNEIKKLYLLQRTIKKFLKRLKNKKISKSKKLFHIKLFIVLLITIITKNTRNQIIKIFKYKYDNIIKFLKRDFEKNPSLQRFIEVRRSKHEKLNTNFSNFKTSNKPISRIEQTSSTIVNDETIYVNVKCLNNKYLTAIRNSNKL